VAKKKQDCPSGDISSLIDTHKPDFMKPSSIFAKGAAPDWLMTNDLIIPSFEDIPPLSKERAFRLGYLGLPIKYILIMYDMTREQFDYSPYHGYWKKGQAVRNEAIAGSQLHAAIFQKNITMQIFLGKNGLDQADSPDKKELDPEDYSGHSYSPVELKKNK
jgi:hypothetical protein